MTLEEYYGDLIVRLVDEYNEISHEHLFIKFCERDNKNIEHNDIVHINFNTFINQELKKQTISRSIDNQSYVYYKKAE